jgi:hypothetical protein
MQETKVTVAEAMEDDDEEEGYVQVGTRFYRVTMRPTGGGGGAVARRRSLHYLESCYLCKESIACDRDVFMYKYVRAPSRHRSVAFNFFLPAPPSLFRSLHQHTHPMAHGAMECGVPVSWLWRARVC